MNAHRGLAAAATLLMALGLPARADEIKPVGPISFALTAPTEFQGEWERPATPFVNPIDMRNWVNVRIVSIEGESGRVKGKFDLYVHSLCYDLVDVPFDGAFDGQVLSFSVDYTQCPLMKPLKLRLWKDESGFRARANWWPIAIKKVVSVAAP